MKTYGATSGIAWNLSSGGNLHVDQKPSLVRRAFIWNVGLLKLQLAPGA